MKKLRYLLGISLVVITTWMAYDNVFSDEAPIMKLAEDAACKVQKCTDQHGLTRMSRNPLGQNFEFAWKNKTVTLWCHRDFYVVGTRTCTVD